MSELIAFIGIGNMGSPMAENLVKAGKKVRAFDISKKIIEQAKEKNLDIVEKADILNLNSGVVGGMLNIINNTAFEISPTVFASCSPGGVIEDNCYLDIKNKILKK